MSEIKHATQLPYHFYKLRATAFYHRNKVAIAVLHIFYQTQFRIHIDRGQK